MTPIKNTTNIQKKNILTILLGLLILFFSSGTVCAETANPVTFEDDLGRTLVLEKP